MNPKTGAPVLGFMSAFAASFSCSTAYCRNVQPRRVARVLGAVIEQPGWDFSENLRRQGLQKNGSSRSKLFAKWKWKWWQKDKESVLDKEDALPLSMAYPDSKPLSKEEVEKIASCDPNTENCKNVIYQWTGVCRRCQGTGLVTFYRKKGRKVISKCILCLGIGYVNKHTSREAVEPEDIT